MGAYSGLEFIITESRHDAKAAVDQKYLPGHSRGAITCKKDPGLA
jgi:hypothetical protein